jgi:tetratricopeptide (TPR) repeat protein
MQSRPLASAVHTRLRTAAPLLIVLAVAVLHWPPAGAEFAYDDRDLVQTNAAVHSLAAGLAGFTLPFPPDQPGRALYRPLTQLSYAVDHAVFGMNARAFHAVNVLLYALVCAGVWWLAAALLGPGGSALAVAVLWALHPVHSEVVDGVAGRSELLALGFSLASLLVFLRRSGRAPAWSSAALYALACLSKESGAIAIAVIAVTAWARHPPPRARGWLDGLRPLAPHAVVLIGYFALRAAVLGQLSPDVAILRDAGPLARLLTAGAVFAENLRLLVAPLTLQPDFYYQVVIGVVEAPGWRALAGIAAAAALLAGAVALTWRHASAPAPLGPPAESERCAAIVGFAFFFGFLLPTSHLIDIGALMAERFLFAPSVGFLLLAVVAAERLRRRIAAPPVLAMLLVATLAGAGAARSHARAREWRDAELLWRSAAERVHGDVRIHANLAAVYLDRGDLSAAATEIERALALDPDHLPTLGNRGVLELEQGRHADAEATYRQMLELSPEDFLAWYNLGLIALRKGEPDQAAQHFERALAINPNHAWSRRGLEQAGASAPPHSAR